MASVIAGRFAGRLQGDFVVFYIGMRINRLRAVHTWMPVTQAMPRMLRELVAQPELGFLHAESALAWRTFGLIQYWRSHEHLQAYAHARDKAHLPAWAAFQKAARGNSAVGIFHETYLVPAGQYETIYADMPVFGLGRAGELVPAVGSMASAAARLRREAGDEQAPASPAAR